jgi:hypothetical protein
MKQISSVPKSVMSPSSGIDVVSSAHITMMLTVAVFKTLEAPCIFTWLIAQEDTIICRLAYLL